MEEGASKFPLHDAARQGNVDLASEIVKSSKREAKRKDADGRLPIHWATSSNCHDIVLSLAQLRDFDPDVQDDSGWTPLMIAASVKDSEETLSLLLAKGADVNQKNYRGQTALHFVASKNNLDVARMLLQQDPPASTRIRDKRGQYPIHRAAAVGAGPMISLLLKHKSPIDSTDNEGYTALHHAIAEGHGDAAVTLLKAGADPSKRNKDEVLAIDVAPDKGVRRYVERMAEAEGIEMS